MPEIYDKEYFEYGLRTGKSGYMNYRWLPDRIHKEIRSIIDKLEINPRDKVLDIGSAKGYWVKGFRNYNIQAYGFDTSKYAYDHADKEVKKYLYKKFPKDKKYDFIVSRNTFEHIKEKELKSILKKCLKMTDIIFFTVPLTKSIGGEFIMQALDTTHEIKWPNEKWINFCEECGWKVKNFYQMKGIHEKWDSYPHAIGFYILRK